MIAGPSMNCEVYVQMVLNYVNTLRRNEDWHHSENRIIKKYIDENVIDQTPN